jgi:hypothetical protein
MLKDEAICRGNAPEQLPTTKAGLLEYLVDGSVHLKETRAWKEVEAIKAQLQTERIAHIANANETKQEMERGKKSRSWKYKEFVNQEYQNKQAQEQVQRAKEVELQRALHTHSFPMVRSHPIGSFGPIETERCTTLRGMQHLCRLLLLLACCSGVDL